ncbi:MAG: ABC transporter permease [Nostoc sp. ZfuVER08]|uniref:Transport permease protein n=1 Tax=Nostoc punctiforme FACHB-252 TaxID=1357509 RepID=A0ABR8HEM1_NOSPU|nr:ABC transporter permease [Nostoc punctiforme]MBD2614223.1 ABC transporter permease [Nostoc punctiforme FACHB-252]MBL1197548.1 ABC transporter permease [Nostoc sp. GBBB01]MDZ8014348.1 ABC transporter permease [Nostoc sp. ZfuVER08]
MKFQKALLSGKSFKTSQFQILLADSLTIFWGDWLDLRARVVQVAASGLISPLIYILAFGLGLGSSIKPGSGISGNYDNYLEFILPGMVALSSMTISFGGTTFSICGDRLFSKTFEELLLTPIHPLALHIGKMLAGVVRGLMTSGSVILVAVLLTGNWNFLNPLFLVLLVLNCAVFAGLGVIVGLSVRSLESVGLYNNFIIIPMSFLGATFFDPGTLPAALKVVVYLLPLTYASIGLRAAAHLPLSQFPWYSIPILLAAAIALSLWGAYKFAHQQD